MAEVKSARARTKAAATRSRVLDSAASVLAEKGYADTSLNDIAKAAGMQAGSLYYHFSSKDALIEETLRFGVSQTYHRVRTAIDEAPGDPLERLRVAIEAQASEALDRSTYTAAHLRTISQIPADIRRELRPEMSRFNTVWRDLLADAQVAGVIRSDLDTESVRLIIIGAISYSVEWPKEQRSKADEVVRTLVEMTMNGIKAS